MAKPLSFSHAGAAQPNASESLCRFESPEAFLFCLATPISDVGDHDRFYKVYQERMERAFHELPLDNPRRFLTRAIGDLNAALFSSNTSAADGGHLQASIVCLFVSGGSATYAHIGNARLYLLRDSLIQSVTQDHTQAQQMADQALLKQDEARHHPLSKVILRTIGKKPIIDVPVQGPVALKKGDHYILCSNGLVRRLDDNQIGNKIVSGDLHDVCGELSLAAQEVQGESDEIISLQAVRFGDSASHKVVAYNPLDNIAKSLMSREGRVQRDEVSRRGWLVRAALGALMLLYILIFAICDPRFSSPGKWFSSDPDAAAVSSAGGAQTQSYEVDGAEDPAPSDEFGGRQ